LLGDASLLLLEGLFFGSYIKHNFSGDGVVFIFGLRLGNKVKVTLEQFLFLFALFSFLMD
jgi:hypothetical protein